MKRAAYIPVVLAFLFGGMMMVVGLSALFKPPTYKSTARFNFNQAGGSAPFQAWLASRSATSFTPETFAAEPVLLEVITNLGLQKQWSEPLKVPLDQNQSLSTLRSLVEVQQIGSTTLFGICVRGDDPKEVARIANEIVAVNQRHRLEEWRDQYMAFLLEGYRDRQAQLERQLQELESSLPDRSLEVERLRQQLTDLKTQAMVAMAEAQPARGVIQIIDQAEPSLRPAGPNRVLFSGVTVLGGGVTVAALLALLFLMLSGKRNP